MKKTQLVSELPAAKSWLVVHGEPKDGLTYALRKDVVTVGKDSRNTDFMITDPAISNNHIRLRRQGEHYELTDLASLNGTWVNSKRVQKCLLSDDDVIRIGNTFLVYKHISANINKT